MHNEVARDCAHFKAPQASTENDLVLGRVLNCTAELALKADGLAAV
jgi:hypothetical protein